MNNEIGNTTTLAIHFGRTWERAAGTFAIYPLPRLMTSLLRCFSDMHSSSPHADIGKPTGGIRSAVLLHCSAGNARPVPIFICFLCSVVFTGFWPGFMIEHPLTHLSVMLTWTSWPERQVCITVLVQKEKWFCVKYVKYASPWVLFMELYQLACCLTEQNMSLRLYPLTWVYYPLYSIWSCVFWADLIHFPGMFQGVLPTSGLD